MTIPDWQFISIIISIVGSAVGATSWITWKIAKAETEINNLKENLKKAEVQLDYMFKLSYEEALKASERLRTLLYSSKKTAATETDEG
jgi:hypothetical protein